MGTTTDSDITFVDYDYKRYFKQIKTFDCGNAFLNDFLAEAHKHNYTTKLVFINEELVAYISYCCSSLAVKAEIKDNSIHCEKLLPAIEIGYYAVATKYQGEKKTICTENKEVKFSAFVFTLFLYNLYDIAHNNIMAKVITAFTIDTPKNIAFAHKMGFKDLPIKEYGNIHIKWNDGCIPVFMSIPSENDIQSAIGIQ